MVIAAKCAPVRSSWVQQFVLTCDNELAVQFKNGVCCLYPGTTKALFQVALSFGSPGKFVHAFLYKKRAYVLIKPPCPAQDCTVVGIQTGCCPLPVPMTLHFSVTGGGICNGSYAITYDPLVPAGWIFVGPFGNCTSLRTEVLRCNANGSWHVTTPATLGGDVFLFTCTPLAITLIGQDMTPCGGTAGATVTVTT